MRQFERDWLELGCRVARSLHYQHGRNLRLMQAAQADVEIMADERTTLAARAKDIDGITWSSSAEFQATSAGTVSLDQPSLGGSYTGVIPMGLFTLMTPPPGSTGAAFFHGPAGYDVELEASVTGRVAATTMAKRQGPTAVGVTEKQLRPTKGRISGNLYLPRHITGRRPAVLVFSGSAGGLTTSFAAALLAAHGYPSLALAYFKTPGLPQTLSSIPLEYFTSALEELRAQPGWIGNQVLVAGESRGGEAALLLGAFPPAGQRGHRRGAELGGEPGLARHQSRHPGSVRSLQATQHQDVHGGRDGERRGAARARPRVVP